MNRTGTDKMWAHHYDTEYERHFEPIRDKGMRILEIGIGGYNVVNRGGESLRAWRDYFPNAQIIGIDIEDKSFLVEDRIITFQCDQGDRAQMEELNERCGPFDIVIDDGSHRPSDAITSFETLFPEMPSGGIYVIEDLATHYSPDHGGYPWPLDPTSRPTMIGHISQLIDGLHWKAWKNRAPSDLQRMVRSVHVSEELVFIYKR